MAQPREIVPDGSIVSGANGSGSTIAAKRGVRSSGTTYPDQIALPAAITNPGFGVTKEAIADGAVGGVQRSGRVIAVSSAAITRGAQVDCDTAGKFLTHTTGTIWGVANTATTAADQEFELDLALPGTAVS